MKRSYIGMALGALVAVGAALSLPSCGHSQKLVSLTITPTTFTFWGRVSYLPLPTHGTVHSDCDLHPSPGHEGCDQSSDLDD